jgi:hypothetical protein
MGASAVFWNPLSDFLRDVLPSTIALASVYFGYRVTKMAQGLERQRLSLEREKWKSEFFKSWGQEVGQEVYIHARKARGGADILKMAVEFSNGHDADTQREILKPSISYLSLPQMYFVDFMNEEKGSTPDEILDRIEQLRDDLISLGFYSGLYDKEVNTKELEKRIEPLRKQASELMKVVREMLTNPTNVKL